MAFYVGVELNAQNYFFDFAVDSSMKLSKTTAAFMAAGMTGSYSLFRGISIFTATKVSSERMLHIHFSIAYLGTALLVVAGHIESVELTWVSVILMGSGFSCIFPCMYGYIEERIVVTNFLAGSLTFAKIVLTIVNTELMGKFIKKLPMLFAYINFGGLSMCILIFIGLFFIERSHKKKWQSNLLNVSKSGDN